MKSNLVSVNFRKFSTKNLFSTSAMSAHSIKALAESINSLTQDLIQADERNTALEMKMIQKDAEITILKRKLAEMEGPGELMDIDEQQAPKGKSLPTSTQRSREWRLLNPEKAKQNQVRNNNKRRRN